VWSNNLSACAKCARVPDPGEVREKERRALPFFTVDPLFFTPERSIFTKISIFLKSQNPLLSLFGHLVERSGRKRCYRQTDGMTNQVL
jgi:hypothetical protein